jgi:hypothetical protein
MMSILYLHELLIIKEERLYFQCYISNPVLFIPHNSVHHGLPVDEFSR